jgi:hypothetical protein
MTVDLLRAALEYAVAGRPVFPCDWRPGDHAKAPLVPSPGYHLATVDLQQIINWWGKWPWAMIGSPVPVDEVCIDVDPRKDGDIWALIDLVGLKDLPPTRTVISGRHDGGQHQFFLRPVGDYESARFPRGIDLKDAGKGYTILPPSVHPDTGGLYFYRAGTEHLCTALPTEIHDLLLKRPKPKFVWTGTTSSKSKHKGMVAKVAAEPEGNRQPLGFWAANRLVEENAPIEAWDELEQAMLANGATRHDIVTALRYCPDGRFMGGRYAHV